MGMSAHKAPVVKRVSPHFPVSTTGAFSFKRVAGTSSGNASNSGRKMDTSCRAYSSRHRKTLGQLAQ